MTSRRQLKAAEAIREVVASAIVTEIRDPRVQGVTVVGVEVTADMREAKVKVSVMGDEKQEKLSLHGLANSAGFLQKRIAQRIDTKNTPKLRFEVDKGLQNAMTVNEILERIRREKESPDSDGSAADGTPTAADNSVPPDELAPTTEVSGGTDPSDLHSPSGSLEVNDPPEHAT